MFVHGCVTTSEHVGDTCFGTVRCGCQTLFVLVFVCLWYQAQFGNFVGWGGGHLSLSHFDFMSMLAPPLTAINQGHLHDVLFSTESDRRLENEASETREAT